jgi:2-C-methyl-D-erythritol 4-phosphate cytidylyltransferase
MTWVVVPAAGVGVRMGAALPKQYLPLGGDTVLAQTLRQLARHSAISGLMVVLAADDQHWPGWTELLGKPVRRVVGGETRSESVLSGLRGLPLDVHAQDLILVHDAARPCLRHEDLSRLLSAAAANPIGALLASPVADTLKRADEFDRSAATVPRAGLWRALTPQAFRRAELVRALETAQREGVQVTDEASAFERLDAFPQLVEGAADNIKITTPADLALAEFLLRKT